MFFKTISIIFFTLLFIGCSKNNKLPNKCYQKANIGMCKAYFKKYYFNQKSNKCESYIYGGCGEVAFHTLKECKQTCEE